MIFTTQLFSTFVSKGIKMIRKQLHSIKIIAVLTAFILFWIMTIAYLLPTKYFRKKTPKIAWCYDQLFGQKWNFFTQPHLYNDRLVIVLKNTTTNQITDSVDVLNELWKDKKNHAPFNTKEDVLDHIMFRQTAHLRALIDNAQVIANSNKLHNKKDSLTKIISSIVEADIHNHNTIYNLEVFAKMMLQKQGLKIDINTQYKMLFFTDHIPEFKKDQKQNCVLDFESSYKNFK